VLRPGRWRAVVELNLTASALSHQLNILEDQVGVKLFTRTGRWLAFTNAGQELHVEVDDCLTRVTKALRNLRPREKQDVLVVNSMPTFATHWLIPRFASFQKENMSIEIRVSALPVYFERDNIHCSVYFGNAHRPGLVSELLREVSLMVVCAPSAISKAKPLAEVGDLIHHQLLRTNSGFDGQKLDDWDVWFASAHDSSTSESALPPSNIRELLLDNRNLVIQAAKSGLGIAVLDPMMIKEELASGSLIQPLSHIAKARSAYYLAYPSTSKPSENVLAFRDWLLSECKR
jgi:LysR family transcriptional regulator, glycine cleavage system transcriptional activator